METQENDYCDTYNNDEVDYNFISPVEVIITIAVIVIALPPYILWTRIKKFYKQLNFKTLWKQKKQLT